MIENQYSPEFVKGLFNRMSSSYERMNYITSFGFSIRWRRQSIKVLETNLPSPQIIDLLAGMGETWHSLKTNFPDATISALDFSEEMIKRAKAKNQNAFNGSINVLQQDILNNKLPANHYDIVCCAYGLKTFNEEQLKQLAIETKRILKPGGAFSFVEVSKPEGRIMQLLYGFYLGKIIPIIGNLLLANATEYKMLWHYTNNFINAKRAKNIFEEVGLSTNYKSYFFGCATGIDGKKK